MILTDRALYLPIRCVEEILLRRVYLDGGALFTHERVLDPLNVEPLVKDPAVASRDNQIRHIPEEHIQSFVMSHRLA